MTKAAWDQIFDCWGIKTVSHTDKSKAAYVLTVDQLNAITEAGVKPSKSEIIEIRTPFGPNAPTVKASFYYSERLTSDGRPPEPRMGRALISKWLEAGDEVLIGSIGKTLYALKLHEVDVQSSDDIRVELARVGPRKEVFALAKEAPPKPGKKSVQRNEYVRNPYVVAAALLRANDECEMPSCKNPLFRRDNGRTYLEVHHIVPLAEKGEDSLANVAALCPHCHREQHFGEHRKKLRRALKKHIMSKKAQ